MTLIPYGGERGVSDPLRGGRLTGTLGRAPSPLDSWLDPYRILSILRRRLRLMALVALAVFLVILLPTLAAPRLYTATALVVLDQRQEQITKTEPVLAALPDSSSVVDTEVEVVKSRQLAERVMDRLNLDADPEFGGDPAAAAAADRQARAAAPGAPAVYSSDEQARRSGVIDAITGHLQAQRVGTTYMISLAFQSPEPRKAARIADAFANQYIGDQLDQKFDARRDANNWLSAKLQDMQGEVQRAEAAVEQYKIAHNLVGSSGETLTEQEVSQYNQQMAEARTQQAEAEARLRAARAQMAAGRDAAGGTLDSPLLRDLRSKRAEVTAKIADYSARFGAKYPDTVAANRQLADIDTQIDAETQRVLNDLEGQAIVARQRGASISSSLNSARGVLAGNSRASVGLQELEREADSVRTLYEGLLTRYKETSSEAGLERADARLVSNAPIPTYPSSPNIPLAAALAFIAALGSAVVAVAVAEIADTSFGTGDEVERRLGLPNLGSIPDLVSLGTTEQPHIYITSRPLSAFAEAFRSLRTTLLHGPLRPKTVAITSALPGEGKTITAVCLAKSAAQAGDKVVVVDCDLRRRRLSTSLGITPKVGLVEVLMGEADLDGALVYDNPTGVGILPLTGDKVTPEDLFGSDAMVRLMEELGSRFDLVVLDTAPVLALADTRALVSHVDALVLLARWRKTPQKAVEHAIRLLRGAEGRIVGVMLSQVDVNQQKRQGYGDPTFYAGAYEKYYVG